MISPGKKIAKAVGIRFIEAGEKKTMAMEVAFEFKEGDQLTKFSWCGWLTEGAMKQTMKTLVEVLEFNGDDRVVAVPPGDARTGMLANQNCINRGKEVELDFDHEQYDGKTRAKIKWVNNIGGGQFAGCSPEVVTAKLSALNFKGMFLAAKQSLPPPPAPAGSPANTDFAGDLPF